MSEETIIARIKQQLFLKRVLIGMTIYCQHFMRVFSSKQQQTDSSSGTATVATV